MPPPPTPGPDPAESPVARNFRATYDLHVEESGEGAPTLYLVHGFGGNAHYWRNWVPELSARYRTKVVDLLGFGRSPAPAGADYTPQAHGERLAELVARDVASAPPGPVLVGHSLGAAVVLLAALALQDRGRSAATPTRPPISGLVLMSPAVYRQPLPRYLSLLRTPLVGDMVRFAPPPEHTMAMGLRGIMGPGPGGRAALANPEMVEGYLAPFRSAAHRAAIVEAARQLDLDAADRLAPRLRELDLPALVLWGEEDRIVPPALARRLAAELPDARGIGFPGVGHLPTEEAAEEFLEPTLAFLASLAIR